MAGDGVTSTWETGKKHQMHCQVVDEDGEPEDWVIDCWCPFDKDHYDHPLTPQEVL